MIVLRSGPWSLVYIYRYRICICHHHHWGHTSGGPLSWPILSAISWNFHELASTQILSSNFNALFVTLRSLVEEHLVVLQREEVQGDRHGRLHLLHALKTAAPELLLQRWEHTDIAGVMKLQDYPSLSYSSYLTPCNICVFKELQEKIRGVPFWERGGNEGGCDEQEPWTPSLEIQGDFMVWFECYGTKIGFIDFACNCAISLSYSTTLADSPWPVCGAGVLEQADASNDSQLWNGMAGTLLRKRISRKNVENKYCSAYPV